MAPVKLYVYDLSHGMARNLSMQFLGGQIDGIWHTSVVVFGKETSYSQGIDQHLPGASHHGNPLEIVDMGETEIDEATYDEYIDELRGHYTADKYHLLDFNCNSFTNDVIGFLTGGSIPPHIKDLPSDFLATPMGRQMRPMIDNMFRRPGVPPYPTPADTPPSGVPSPTSALNPQLATSLLQSVAAQATSTSGTHSSTAPISGAGSSLTSHLHISTNLASFENVIQHHRATVVLFVSASKENKDVDRVFERLARDKAKMNAVAFVKVDKEVGNGAEVLTKCGISATPSFQFYQQGEKVGELLGAKGLELKSRVQNLLDSAFPVHPHESLILPTMQAISLQPILFTQVPASLDAPVNKLISFIDALPSPTSDVSAMKKTLKTSFAPFLKTHLPASTSTSRSLAAHTPNPNNTNTAAPTARQIREWSDMTNALISALPPTELFPLVDLWRLAILDGGIAKALSSSSTTEHRSVVANIQSRVTDLVNNNSTSATGTATEVPRPLLLTTLRLSTNTFAHQAPASSSPQSYRLQPPTIPLVVSGLLHSDAGVRTAAASLAFNVAAIRHAPLRRGKDAYWEEVDRREKAAVVSGGDGEGEGDVELVCALLEALEREVESEEVVHRLTASLALFLYLSPAYATDLGDLLQVLGAKEKVLGKLLPGGCGPAGVTRVDVRNLVEEVGKQLCP
ncbi:hypothetical protein BS47DRAFT_1340874 [Hydnum rufescens UP504]|uniref:DUF862-domain-containing protein n=1 Tax=Hydnum rufescens UP504 TaxID=1448309 RepID=A0A9P6B2H8_9AGAM|nr:hypothetical protein BS47DRAFT_1340874 [Hydnum rufescens UP504]